MRREGKGEDAGGHDDDDDDDDDGVHCLALPMMIMMRQGQMQKLLTPCAGPNCSPLKECAIMIESLTPREYGNLVDAKTTNIIINIHTI